MSQAPGFLLDSSVALGAFFEVLSRHTIADLAKKKRSIRERLGITTAEAVSESVAAISAA